MAGPRTPFFELIDADFPVVTLVLRRPPESGGMQSLQRRLDAVLARRERFALVIDMTDRRRGTPQDRELAAHWLSDRMMLLHTFCVAMAFVAPTAEARGAVTAILWKAPVPWAVAFFDRPPDAVHWVQERLDAQAPQSPASDD